MQSLIDVILKILPLAIKSQELLDAATSVLVFLRDNQHLIDLALNWLDGMFGGTAEDSDLPEGLDPIADKLQVLKAAM